MQQQRRQKPKWLKAPIPSGKRYHDLKKLFKELNLNTVCEEAQCPNIGDCWQRQTATIMIMGDTCTRSCGFCAVNTGKPLALDPQEPQNVALALSKLKLKHVVITSVDRDDLEDGGAAHFAETIDRVKSDCPDMLVEVLIPDFRNDRSALDLIIAAKPDILNHNLETVASLQKQVRPQAAYERSLAVLKYAAQNNIPAKSGLMLGLGESEEEIKASIQDLKSRGHVSILTLGQYLQPHSKLLPVERFYSPQEFEELKTYAESIGIPEVASGPMIRSSYHADISAEKIL